MNANELNQLMFDGYLVASVDIPNLEAMLDRIIGLDYQPIFERVGGAMDAKRLQAVIPHEMTRMFNCVKLVMEQWNALWSMADVVALKSIQGGKTQQPHCDMSPQRVAREIARSNVTPVGVLLALMPDTTLRVYKGCFGVVDRKAQRDVVIQPGQMIVFRGDLTHCGSSYRAMNIRMRFKFAARGFVMRENAVYHAVEISYKCKRCGKAFETPTQRCCHMQWCDKSKKKYQTYMVRNKIPVTCDVCHKPFKLRNSMYQHRRRHYAF